jgi:methyl coenzyme M reductase gamma subunit
MYVPEDEIEPYDLDSEEGDLQLPEPTGDRDRLQKNDVFWDWLSMTFSEKFEEMIYETHKLIEPTDDPIQTIASMDREDLVKSTINLGE